MSNRIITDEQFAAGGAIDGSRIQTALDDVEGFINNVPLSAIKQKYSLNHMVFTYLGADAPAVVGDMPAVIGGCRVNPFFKHEGYPRVKGLRRSSLTSPYPTDYENSAEPYVFTVATVFPGPVILDSLCLWINGIGVSNAGGNGQEHGFPMKSAAGDSFQRVRVIVDTDDAIAAEDRSLNSKEFVLQDFQERFHAGSWRAPNSTMVPQSSRRTTEWGSETGFAGKTWTANPLSLYLLKKEIELPIHQGARVRFRVVLYQSATLANPLRERTPENVTFTVSYKEALKSG
jgi:hypothetical protein